MIHYDLICSDGHEFDGWFSDSAAYEAQVARDLVACVVCGSVKVDKQLMAPGIPAKSNTKQDAGQPMVAAAADPRMQAMMQMMREFRSHVEQNAENVGDKFAEEARKIHYHEAKPRGIFGNATRDEAIELIEEGIDVAPLPMLPDDAN